MSSAVSRCITLSSGYPMPIVGLGTFQTRGSEIVEQVLDAALKNTAGVYRNETDIGASLQKLLPKYDLLRSDLCITSKLGPKHQGQGKCRKAFLKTLTDLQTSYLDLYLIHWPGAQGMKPEDGRHPEFRQGSWLDMQDLCKEGISQFYYMQLDCCTFTGKVRSIGVSNYTQTHLEELLSFCEMKPSVLQVEHHPHLQQNELREFCKQHDIHYQAYSSLGTSSEDKKVLHDPAVKLIAEKHGVSAAQVLLRWAVQQGIGVIPKSTHPDHIAENLNIFNFDLSLDDMTQIHTLNQELHYCWNPATIT